MSNFDFVFSLFSLLLGLSLAEVLGQFGRAIQKTRPSGRTGWAGLKLGWRTPLLGLFVLLDVVSFWQVGWAIRDAVPIANLTMMGGLIICGLYYIVATLVFPHDFDEWPDLDAYYERIKRAVLGGAIGCNLLALGGTLLLGINPFASLHNSLSIAVFLASATALIWTTNARVSVALLAFIVLQYPLGAGLAAIGW